MILFEFFHLQLMTFFVTAAFGKISYARNGDGSDHTRCFHNLLYKLPITSFSASSVWENKQEFEAHQARMSSMIDITQYNNGQAWCSNEYLTVNPTEWMEIDLGEMKVISSFFTMGRGEGNFKEYVGLFYLEYQREPMKWIRYKNELRQQLLVGNGDSRNMARTQFNTPIIARKIRIYPISKESMTRACMRISIYGCDFNDGVVGYSMPQGHVYWSDGVEKYDFRDLIYDGKESLNPVSHSLEVTEGMGQLMNNLLTDNVSDVAQGRVGWNKNIIKSREVEIIFKFNQIRRLRNISIYTLNIVSRKIGHFASASVHFSIGGRLYDSVSSPYLYQTILDRENNDCRWISIPLQDSLARFLKLKLVFELDWIVLSEIIVTSEATDVNLPIEQEFSKKSLTTTNPPLFHTSSNLNQPLMVSNSKTTNVNKGHEASFLGNSKFGFLITVASCFFGLLLLLSLAIFGFIIIRRHNGRLRKKSRYSCQPPRTTGGPFPGDSLVVPLTTGTHSSSVTRSYHYKLPGSTDLGLNYPVMGREFMTMSSKSGTEYDMAGGHSLDGLMTSMSREGRYPGFGTHLSGHNLPENPYPFSVQSRYSNDESFGSSHTEYATTSLYHFNPVMESDALFNQLSMPNQNIRLLPNNHINSPNSSMEIFVPSQVAEHLPQYQLHRYGSQPYHNMQLYHHLVPESNYNPSLVSPRSFRMPLSQGICGNSLLASFRSNFPAMSLADILSNLREINQKDVEESFIIGEGIHGNIGFLRSRQSDIVDSNNIPILKKYLFKSVLHYATNDKRNEIVQEMSILTRLKHSAFLQLSAFLFDHQNSISTKQSRLYFLFQIEDHMDNLYICLQKQSLVIPDDANISSDDHLYPGSTLLLHICGQIAKGMSYLQRHQIIHRDLAARNCFIGRDKTVKIVDIAMSMKMFKEHYVEYDTVNIQRDETGLTGQSPAIIRHNYPLQWMASESILQGIFSVETDVWSFGVTMWEILTRCKQAPYGELGITVDLLIENAYNLTSGAEEGILPNNCIPVRQWKCSNKINRPQVIMASQMSIFESIPGLNRDILDLIRQCWLSSPLQRPSFDDINGFLELKIPKIDLRYFN